MRLIIFIIIFLLIEWYIFSALKVLVEGYSPIMRRGFSIIYWMISLGFIGFLFYLSLRGERTVQNSPLIYVQSLFMIYFLSKVFILLFLVIDDFRRLLTNWLSRGASDAVTRSPRSKFLLKLGVIMASLPFFTLLYGKIMNTFRFKVRNTKIPITGLPEDLEGFKIVQISDIHSGSFVYKDPLIRAVNLINAQKPDLVLFTGDLVNNTADEVEGFMDVLDKIESKQGVFSVLGNHDYGDYVDWPDQASKKANLDRLKNIHRNLGWNLLLNSNSLLSIGSSILAVIGVENYSVYDRFPTYGKLSTAYEGTDKADFRLLMSHDPSHWEDEVTSQFKKIHLTCSGHTHGMQFGVEIPGWIKWSPVKLMYKQWAGLYQNADQYLYVNRGLGFIGYAGRVGILPEISVLELTKKV